MVGPSLIEEVDTEHYGDFLDHIDDLLDFSNEDFEGVLGGDGLETGAWPSETENLALSTSALSDHSTHSSEGCLPTELDVPSDDILQLEWLSNFVDDSSAGNMDLTYQNYNSTSNSNSNCNNNKKDALFHTSSPISVLETSSNSSSGKPFPPLITKAIVPARARSKRPRPAAFCPRPITVLLSPSTSSETDTPILSVENFGESRPQKMIMKKKKNNSLFAGQQGALQHAAIVSVRRCLHCQIEKTPQWRLGPMGPKTLCNACGVRYKSGRLFPEYRPAASPTFVPSLHSNSHKKVLEMRIKANPMGATEEKSRSLLDYFRAG